MWQRDDSDPDKWKRIAEHIDADIEAGRVSKGEPDRALNLYSNFINRGYRYEDLQKSLAALRRQEGLLVRVPQDHVHVVVGGAEHSHLLLVEDRLE